MGPIIQKFNDSGKSAKQWAEEQGISYQSLILWKRKLKEPLAFVNKRRELMKVIYFDGDGLAIWAKRLEKGRFGRHLSSSPLMDRRSFLMLLEGVIPRRMNRRYKHS